MSSFDNISVTWIRGRALPTRLQLSTNPHDINLMRGYLTVFAASNARAAWRWPWVGEASYSNFWARSLGGSYETGVRPAKAWKRHVPLREAQPPALTTSQAGVALTADRYVFPTGVGVTVRADLAGSLDAAGVLAAVTGTASSVRLGNEAPAAMPKVLDALLLGAQHAWLAADDSAAVQNPPITIATVTSTTDWPYAPIAQGDATHRLLDALARRTAAPLTGAVGQLAKGLLDESGSYPGTSRYVVGRGLATCCPDQSSDPAQQHKLRCYHANQTLAALHIDLFLDTAQWAANTRIAALSPDVREALEPVALTLGLLWGKVSDMYASAFARRLISDSGLLPAINSLRTSLGVGVPLS